MTLLLQCPISSSSFRVAPMRWTRRIFNQRATTPLIMLPSCLQSSNIEGKTSRNAALLPELTWCTYMLTFPMGLTQSVRGLCRYWGPWQRDGPVEPPSPPPPPPHAPTQGFFLRHGDAGCLSTLGLKRGATIVVGPCDGGAKWKEDTNGHLYNVAAQESHYSYLRQRPDLNCTVINYLELGLVHSEIGTVLQDSRLVLTGCAKENLCIAPSRNTSEAIILDCSSSASSGWIRENERPVLLPIALE
eukprot:m.47253 g.47253  ORF g.47253 m.47253 type:complete len:245 (+) comp6346_c0_seq4:1399-2133(+)